MKDPLLLSYTREDLTIEYLMDEIEEDPNQAYPQKVADGTIIIHRTNDPVFNRIEEEAAAGNQDIDVLAELPQETRDEIMRFARLGMPKPPVPKEEPPAVEDEEFNDNYGDDK